MKKSSYTNYEELPLFLNAEFISEILGISISSAYELMHGKDFPTLKVGNRMVVPKEHQTESKNGFRVGLWLVYASTNKGN